MFLHFVPFLEYHKNVLSLACHNSLKKRKGISCDYLDKPFSQNYYLGSDNYQNLLHSLSIMTVASIKKNICGAMISLQKSRKYSNSFKNYFFYALYNF